MTPGAYIPRHDRNSPCPPPATRSPRSESYPRDARVHPRRDGGRRRPGESESPPRGTRLVGAHDQSPEPQRGARVLCGRRDCSRRQHGVDVGPGEPFSPLSASSEGSLSLIRRNTRTLSFPARQAWPEPEFPGSSTVSLFPEAGGTGQHRLSGLTDRGNFPREWSRSPVRVELQSRPTRSMRDRKVCLRCALGRFGWMPYSML